MSTMLVGLLPVFIRSFSILNKPIFHIFHILYILFTLCDTFTFALLLGRKCWLGCPMLTFPCGGVVSEDSWHSQWITTRNLPIRARCSITEPRMPFQLVFAPPFPSSSPAFRHRIVPVLRTHHKEQELAHIFESGQKNQTLDNMQPSRLVHWGPPWL